MAPRLPRGGKTPPPPKDAKPGDNAAAMLRAEEAQFLSFLARIRPKLAEKAIIKTQLDEKAAEITEIFRLAKAAGFERKELQGILDDLGAKKANHPEKEARRVRFRRWVGLPVGESDELKASTPDEVKDAMWWEAEGYRAGIRADEPKPPEGCSPRMDQAWMKGYHNGQTRNAWALSEANPTLSAGGGVRERAAEDFAADNPALPEGAAPPDWTEFADDPAAWTPDQQAAFDNWYDAMPEGVAPLLSHPGVKAAWAKAVAAEEPFEASDDELAAQAGRPSTEVLE